MTNLLIAFINLFVILIGFIIEVAGKKSGKGSIEKEIKQISRHTDIRSNTDTSSSKDIKVSVDYDFSNYTDIPEVKKSEKPAKSKELHAAALDDFEL